MTPILIITIVVTLFGAVCAMSLRNLVHCALTLAVTFAGIAAFYLQLSAEFVGFAEILVYVGAVAILIVMAILLTCSGDTPDKSVLTAWWGAGVIVMAGVFATLCWAVLNTHALLPNNDAAPQITVKDIGTELMTTYALPLEIIGLVLTAAMIGGVLIALQEAPEPKQVTEAAKAKEVPAASLYASTTIGGPA